MLKKEYPKTGEEMDMIYARDILSSNHGRAKKVKKALNKRFRKRKYDENE